MKNLLVSFTIVQFTYGVRQGYSLLKNLEILLYLAISTVFYIASSKKSLQVMETFLTTNGD